MAQTTEDPSMTLLRFTGTEMASQPIALALAEMIFKHVYGESDFESQLPLHVIDGGDRWIIEGSREPDDYAPIPGEVPRGKMRIVILKANCQVVQLTQKVQLPIESK